MSEATNKTAERVVCDLWVLVNSDRRKFGSCMFRPEKMGIIRTQTVNHGNSDRELGPY